MAQIKNDTNCPNCGAPYQHGHNACVYCGTDRYYDPETQSGGYWDALTPTFTGTEFRNWAITHVGDGGNVMYGGGSDAAACSAAACIGGCF